MQQSNNNTDSTGKKVAKFAARKAGSVTAGAVIGGAIGLLTLGVAGIIPGAKIGATFGAGT